MRTPNQPKKAYQAPYIQCFHHITAEEILGDISGTLSGQDPETGEGVGMPTTKQTSFFFDEDEEEEEEDGYYW